MNVVNVVVCQPGKNEITGLPLLSYLLVWKLVWGRYNWTSSSRSSSGVLPTSSTPPDPHWLRSSDVVLHWQWSLPNRRRCEEASPGGGHVVWDTQNSHVWKEIHFPNHHFWYLCLISGVYMDTQNDGLEKEVAPKTNIPRYLQQDPVNGPRKNLSI